MPASLRVSLKSVACWYILRGNVVVNEETSNSIVA